MPLPSKRQLPPLHTAAAMVSKIFSPVMALKKICSDVATLRPLGRTYGQTWHIFDCFLYASSAVVICWNLAKTSTPPLSTTASNGWQKPV